MEGKVDKDIAKFQGIQDNAFKESKGKVRTFLDACFFN